MRKTRQKTWHRLRPRTPLALAARRSIVVLLVGGWLVGLATAVHTAPGQPQPTASTSEDTRAVLDRYCVGCHNERLLTDGLALDGLDATTPAANAEVWERVIQQAAHRHDAAGRTAAA